MSMPAPAERFPGEARKSADITARRGRRIALLLLALILLGSAGVLGGLRLWALNHFRAGQQALQRYDFPEALEHLERCLRAWPNQSAAHLLAAQAARRADLLERAEAHLQACEQGRSTPETALEQLLLRAQRGELGEVEGLLQRLILDNHPEKDLVIEALIQGYLRLSAYGRAHGALTDLLESEPDHPWAWYWRGQLQDRVDRPAKALADYRRAVELAPHRAIFRLHLALALVQTGRHPEARPMLERLLRERPKDPEVRLGLARCLRGLNLPGEAIPHLDLLLGDHPDHAVGWAERGLAFRDQGDSTEAVRCLRRAFALQPYSYAIVFALFTELRAQGNEQEARILQERVESTKRDQLRIQELTAQQAGEPHNAELRCEIGKIFLRNQSDAAALHWLFAALQVDPNHRPTHAALAEYYQAKGNIEAAALHRQRATAPE
jgi:tetratricopeptide (TPR) repeat protein